MSSQSSNNRVSGLGTEAGIGTPEGHISGGTDLHSEGAFDLKETICGLIAKQAQDHPERTAVIDGDLEIAYKRFLARADEIAGELLTRGVEPGSLVGVCLSRSWELIATLVGVLRAGCAYVPLDPVYPRERVRYMLQHSRAAAAIVENEHTASLCEDVPALIWLNEARTQPGQDLVGPKGNDLAYVIYTSGSTGQPKGVAVEHRNVVAMSRAMGSLFSAEELNGFLAAASVCFDTSVMETLGTLSLGGTMVLAQNALQLPKLPMAHKVRSCVMVPSSMQALLASETLPSSIRCVIFGGEALKLSLANQIHSLAWSPRVLNFYGPTEDTVFSTTSEIPKDTRLVTIGKSVPGSRAYVLDESMNPLPPKVPGELFLAGNKLARGYLYDDAQTQARFPELEPSEAIPEHRLYRTGDLVQWNEKGEIEFLGRVDQQVKIRGFRIELEEIESTLETMTGVDAAAAAALEGATGQKILVIYVVAKDEAVNEETVKAYLAARLPKYMVPQLVMPVKALPLLPNEKLDRKRLPGLEEVLRAGQPQAAGSGSGEEDLNPLLNGNRENQSAAILSIIQREVASLLHFNDPNQISAHLAFESFGIDSLTTLELSSRLGKALGRKVPSEAIFEHITPHALTNHILNLMGRTTTETSSAQSHTPLSNSLANFQTNIRSSHPTFQAAKASAWSATDKGKLVQEVMRMVNNDRRNPYSKVIKTGSASRGTVTDAYTDEKQEAVIWTTNLYLGMNRDQKVMEESRAALESFGTGMGTSAAASGLTDLHLNFETEFAELVGKPSACLFPTGYTANVGCIAGLLGRNDVVVIDQLCHASIVDGARLCGATVRTFKHNDEKDLESVLEAEVSPYRTVLVVLEGVYSMGEGAAPVAKIVRTAKKFGALVLVDEAHSFGFYGENGAGICADQGVTDQVDFIMTTLSKALGSLGGVVAASKEHVELLKSSARAYIFQASISPADMAAALTSLRRLSTDPSLSQRLWDTTRYMRQRFTEAGYDLGTGDGPIVTPHFADKDKLYALVQGMYQRGVQTSAVTYPIVEVGRGRLRLICSASHTKDDVDKTLAALIDAEREYDQKVTVTAVEQEDLGLGRAEVQDWAAALSAYIRDITAEDHRPLPDLAVAVKVHDATEPITFMIQDQAISIGSADTSGIPTCNLELTHGQAVTALCSFDVQALLKSICKGTCILNGQVEPFIWLIGRIVDRQKEVKPHEVLQPC